MIDSNRKKNKSEYDADRLAQSSFGCSDDQLLEMMRSAQEEISDDQIPPESEGSFERLVAEQQRRGLTAHFEHNDGKKNKDDWTINDDIRDENTRKIIRFEPLIKVALAAAIIGSVLVATGVTAGAKKSYEYGAKTRIEVSSNIVISNESDITSDAALEQAYIAIYNQVGIKVLKIGDAPENLKYLKTVINNQRATMYFDYKGESFYIIQKLGAVESSINIATDQLSSKSIYNAWLDSNISVEKAVTDNGKTEFSAYIADENAYYYLVGVMDEEGFLRIVEDLSFYKQ